MRRIETDIQIGVPAAKVWEILMELESYADWNPFIREINGKIGEGNTIEVRMKVPGKPERTFKPTIVKLEPNNELRWLGHMWWKGVFDGEHVFKLKELSSDQTKFTQIEIFSGFLTPIILSSYQRNIMDGFRSMNRALRDRAHKIARETRD